MEVGAAQSVICKQSLACSRQHPSKSGKIRQIRQNPALPTEVVHSHDTLREPLGAPLRAPFSSQLRVLLPLIVLPIESEEDKRATTNVQNGLVFLF